MTDTIAAIATAAGVGGIGIVRVSGPSARAACEAIIGRLPAPRRAHFADFKDQNGQLIDQGLVLLFPAPQSFTGEDVIEFQGHGGPVVLDLLLQAVLQQGVRLARPGEFAERAFLNGKLDLTQVEAIADLIESGTHTAARLAGRSLQGAFSREIARLQQQLTELRMYVEAAIDFPEEEIDFLSDSGVTERLTALKQQLAEVERRAATGVLLRDGMQLVIAGRPNAGKSSLLNVLAGRDSAIVTEIPGTTRDLLREQIQIDGMPLHLIDTAGLRDSRDRVEQEGMRRAREAIATADRILWVYEASAGEPQDVELESLPTDVPLTLVRNKIDQLDEAPAIDEYRDRPRISLSAKTESGVEQLRDHLKASMGYGGEQQGDFLARRRHLDALRRAEQRVLAGEQALTDTQAGELLAEELRLAQQALGEITGEFTADDLLGQIFAGFCIGK